MLLLACCLSQIMSKTSETLQFTIFSPNPSVHGERSKSIKLNCFAIFTDKQFAFQIQTIQDSEYRTTSTAVIETHHKFRLN